MNSYDTSIRTREPRAAAKPLLALAVLLGTMALAASALAGPLLAPQITGVSSYSVCPGTVLTLTGTERRRGIRRTGVPGAVPGRRQPRADRPRLRHDVRPAHRHHEGRRSEQLLVRHEARRHGQPLAEQVVPGRRRRARPDQDPRAAPVRDLLVGRIRSGRSRVPINP